MASDPLVLAVLAAGVGTGAFIDLRTRRVPNVLTFTLAAAGVACAVAGLNNLSVAASLVGFALGLALMLPGYAFGATGAGDVKLLAAVGALIGPAAVAAAFLYSAITGGILALVIAQRRRRLSATLLSTGRLIAKADNAAQIEHPHADNRFAYAPAIAIGSLLAALGL